MINKKIKNLINELEIPNFADFPLPIQVWIGLGSAYISYEIITWLYKRFSRVTVANRYLKYYKPIHKQFFEFLDIINTHSTEFKYLRASFSNNPKCTSMPHINKEMECILSHIHHFLFTEIQIILSTLYDDGYDLLKIRSIDDIYKAKYTKTLELNKLPVLLHNGMILSDSLLLKLNSESTNQFGIPLSRTFKDITNELNRDIKSIVYESINWK